MDLSAQNILNYLEKKKPRMEAFLKELVAIETPSRDPAAQEEIFEVLARKFQQLGYRTFRMPGRSTGGYLMTYPAKRRKGQSIQLLIGHCDTVWEKGTIESMPLITEKEKIKGPGVFDMKAGLTQMLFALQSIQDLDLDLTVTPVCLINADEEIGSRESTRAIQRLARIADRAYVMEPPLGVDGRLKTARKGLGRFTVTVKGRAAHAGLDPGKGASAILELSHQVQKLFALNDLSKGITVNVGMIEGGVSPNVVAPVSRAVVDVRVPSHEDAQEVEKKILDLSASDPNVSLEVEGSFGRPPMERTDRNKHLWQKARQAAEKLNIQIEEASAGGGSDANTTSQYTATLDGLGTTGDGAHAEHEFIQREALDERTALLTLLLLLPPVEKSTGHDQ
ncbi:MAG: M20 family metallopeptidase [Saprospiraceae bacterium]|nr:M20 family metallopeptidase [Saprospiraceae bacterium]